MENVIDGSMAMMAALTPSEAKAMGGKMIHCSTTVVAGVRSTEGGTKSEANCNPDGIIVHSEAKGGDREGIQPSSRLSCGGSQKTSYRSGIGGTFQQGVSSGRHLVGIPGLLAVGGGTNGGRVVMILRPQSSRVGYIGERDILEMRRKDMVGKVGGASSRGQEGRGCQLNCTPDAESTKLHRKGSLGPGRIVRCKMDVSDGTHDGSEPIIIQLEVGGEETRRCSKGIKELWDGEGVTE